jgi:hypothetical protein
MSRFSYCYAECHYAERQYAERHYTERHYAERLYTECRYAACRSACLNDVLFKFVLGSNPATAFGRRRKRFLFYFLVKQVPG